MGIRDHQRRVAALREIERGNCSAAPDSLHLHMIALERDVMRLKQLGTMAQRQELKRTELLPKWLPFVERYLSEDEPHQNPIFAQCIVWLFDVQDFDKALAFVDIAITQGQQTPKTIKRDFAHFAADSVLEWAEHEAACGHPVEPYFSQAFERVKRWQLHEVLAAKYFKFAAHLLLKDEDGRPRASAVSSPDVLRSADELLVQAQRLHKHAQVSTLRAKIAARLRSLEVK